MTSATQPVPADDPFEDGVSRRLRIAFVGKGGAGKSSIAGTLARLLAAGGEPVVCLDSDPLPGLATSLGIATSDAGIPDEAVEEAPEGERARYRLATGLTSEEAIRRYADTGPDGVRFLQFGKTRGHVAPLMRSQFAFRHIVADIDDTPWHVIGDLPAGTRQPFFGWAGFAHLVLVVAEPAMSSMLSAKRLARLGEGENAPLVAAIANKTRRDDDADLVSQATGLPVWASAPVDPAVREAEHLGVPIIDHAPDSPTVQALRSLLERLHNEERSSP
jgi:CO dehydrogenase maturation factor